MAEELEQNDGTWSGLKKTVVGVIGTVVTAGGVYVTTLIGGGKEEAPVQQAAPAPVINITNTNQQQQTATEKTVIVKEVPVKEKEKPKKEGDEFKNADPKW